MDMPFLRRFWFALARPPYAAVPWAVFFYVILSCLIYTNNGPLTGHLVGFDDHVRMVQVLQWMNGGGWYDRLITRVNAPEGFQTIWARIVDIPFAAVILAAQQFTNQHTAALVSSVVVPMAELLIMFWAARYFARPIAGKKEAWLVILFLMFTTVLNEQPHTMAGFHPGEVSHHAWYGILNVLMFGAAVRIVLGVAGFLPRFMLGLSMALLLAVGIEGFATIAGTVLVLSLLSFSFRNHRLAWRGAVSLALASLLSLLFLPLHVPPHHWLEVSFTQPSILGPIVTAVAAMFLTLQSLIQKKMKNQTQVGFLLFVLAVFLGRLMMIAFPALLAGGAAGLSPNERTLVANEHFETWSMLRAAGNTVDYIGLIMPSLLAFGIAIVARLTSGNARRRMMFGAYSGFVLISGGLAQIYWRYIHHAQTAACPVLLYAWQRLRARLPQNNHRSLLSLLAFVALGPFWMLLLPALNQNQPFMSHVALFPAKLYSEPPACDVRSFANYLNTHYPPETLIEVPDWDSATFLYETNLRVDFLANYPSHDHFIDNKYFFWFKGLDMPKLIAERHHFRLVASCTWIPMAPDIAAARSEREPVMLERLKEGTQPSWLKPVDTGLKTNYRLFEVDQTALSADPNQGH